MNADSVNLHWIYRETLNRLDVLHRRVQEGRDVEAASEFARWLIFSGIIKLMEANSSDKLLKVDGPLLRSRTQMLIEACNYRFRRNDDSPRFQAKDVQSLHEKIDLVAGYLSRLNVPAFLTVSPTTTGVNGSPLESEAVIEQRENPVIDSVDTLDKEAAVSFQNGETESNGR